MIRSIALAAGALALGLTLNAPANAGAASVGALAAPLVDVKAGEFAQKATYGYRVPLRRVLRKLRHRGYSGFHNIKWLPHAYVVRAHNWRGKPVRIKVSARSGHIIWVKRIRHHRRQWRYWRY